MPFDSFELELLNDAAQQMTDEHAQRRLSAFLELRKTKLNNEGWFEWEIYYRLLTVDRGWGKNKRSKGNRKIIDRLPGDGVDLQFNNGKFIELRAVTTEAGTLNWAIQGLSIHPDADACLFLALYHKNLKKWIDRYKIDEDIIRYKEISYEMKRIQVNEDWIVGIIKEIE